MPLVQLIAAMPVVPEVTAEDVADVDCIVEGVALFDIAGEVVELFVDIMLLDTGEDIGDELLGKPK